MESPNKLNVIFDIDETLVYFIHKRYWGHSWEKLPEREKCKYKQVNVSSGVFLIRPHLIDLMTWCFENCNVYLWTWSDKEYAEGIAEMVIKMMPSSKEGYKFRGIFHDDHAELSSKTHKNSKDLNWLWYDVKKDKNYKEADFKHFNENNTILIDDLPGNSVNPSNRKNSITIAPFALFGEVKDRSDPYHDVSKDTCLLEVRDFLIRVAAKLQNVPQWENVLCLGNLEKYMCFKKEGPADKYIKTIDYPKKDKGGPTTAIGIGDSIHFLPGGQDGGSTKQKRYKRVSRNKK